MLGVGAAVMLIYAFVCCEQDSVIAYFSYVISAYAFTVFCVNAPRTVKALKKFRRENRFMSRYLSDVQYKMKVSLYGSLAVNIVYVFLQLGFGVYYQSFWYYSIAIYYALLAFMRFFLLRETVKGFLGRDVFREYLHYRLSAVLLLLMNMALAIIVFFIVWLKRGVEYSPIITIAMATYSFGAVITSAVNIKKYRRQTSPITAAAKTVSLMSALVSIVSLETAMLSAFGSEEDGELRTVITAVTGGAVCVAVLAVAVYMITVSTKEIKKLKGEKRDV